MTRWVRVAANLHNGCYDVCEATAKLPEPTWPEEDLRAFLHIAFKDRYVRDLDHPVLRRLRGEV
jgi:hypothetical protein